MTAAFDLKKVKKEKKLWDEDDGKSTTVTDNCEKVAVSRSIKKEGEFQRKRRNRAFLTHMNYAEAKRWVCSSLLKVLEASKFQNY